MGSLVRFFTSVSSSNCCFGATLFKTMYNLKNVPLPHCGIKHGIIYFYDTHLRWVKLRSQSKQHIPQYSPVYPIPSLDNLPRFRTTSHNVEDYSAVYSTTCFFLISQLVHKKMHFGNKSWGLKDQIDKKMEVRNLMRLSHSGRYTISRHMRI